MTVFSLEFLWYVVIIACLIFYSVLDGFDLGVGCLHLFARNDKERRLILNSIGPVWDGNEVWLVIIGGALFAGFPNVFATLFSSFYDFVMILLFGLIFRAVSIEFRSKHESKRWRKNWDIAFCVASLIIAFGVGLVFGNLIQGIPLDKNQDFVGTFSGFINLYSLLFGLTTVALFSMHGSIYLVMKTEGAFHDYVRRWVNRCILAFIACYIVLTIATFVLANHMIIEMKANSWLFLVPAAAIIAILNIPREIKKNRDGWAFISSCMCIAVLLAVFAIGTYPVLIRSSINPQEFSLVISNSASSPLTLKILLIIVLIGIPMVLAYGFYIYRLFRGKVSLDDHSY